MPGLDQLVRQAWSKPSAASIDIPWPSLRRLIAPTGGQQVMVLAAPGVGKTVFLVSLAAMSGAKALYISADTNPTDFTEQLVSLATGHPRLQVKQRLQSSSLWRDSYGVVVEEKFPHLVAEFPSKPEVADVAEMAMARSEMWGASPDLIVVDTAGDVDKENDDSSGWQGLWQNLRALSRFFDCVVCTAQHVKSGPAASGTYPVEKNDGMYKPETFAEIVLGLHLSGQQLNVRVLKNRSGRAGVKTTLKADYAYGRLLEQEET